MYLYIHTCTSTRLEFVWNRRGPFANHHSGPSLLSCVLFFFFFSTLAKNFSFSFKQFSIITKEQSLSQSRNQRQKASDIRLSSFLSLSLSCWCVCASFLFFLFRDLSNFFVALCSFFPHLYTRTQHTRSRHHTNKEEKRIQWSRLPKVRILSRLSLSFSLSFLLFWASSVVFLSPRRLVGREILSSRSVSEFCFLASAAFVGKYIHLPLSFSLSDLSLLHRRRVRRWSDHGHDRSEVPAHRGEWAATARQRAFFIFLFSFSPKEEREKILFSLSERTRAPEILLVVFLSRRWCLSPSLSLV